MNDLQEPSKRSYYFDIQRRVVANKTLEGWRSAPHACILVELDVTNLLYFVHELKQSQEFTDTRVTINTVLLKVIAEGLKRSPEMNAHVEYNRGTAVGRVTLHDAINVAIPFRMADGRMMSPVLEDIGSKSLREVCEAMDALRRRVGNTDLDILLYEAGLHDTLRRLARGQFWVLRRLFANLVGKSRLPHIPWKARRKYAAIPESDRITPANLTSATVLVTNVGSVVSGMNITVEMLELIPPQTAAIALGPIARKPWAVYGDDGEETVALRDILPLTLCIDHRVMDLEHIRGFLDRVWELCQAPRELLARAPASTAASREY